jgi:hypothetical protein
VSAEQHDNPFRPPEEGAPVPPRQPQPSPAQVYGYGQPPAAYPGPGAATGRLSATGYPVPPGGPGWPVIARPVGPRNGLGTAAFVLGVIAACLAWTFVLSFVVVILAVLALIFGILGARRARQGQATNRTAALSGAWTGAASLLVGVIHFVLFVILVTQPVEVESEAGSAYLAEDGDTVLYEDGLILTIPAPQESADGSFVTVSAQLTNDGDDGVGMDSTRLVAHADGGELDAGQVRMTGSDPGTLEPGETQTVTYTVAVPGGTAELGLDFAPSGDHDYAYWVFALDGASGDSGGSDDTGGSGGIDA